MFTIFLSYSSADRDIAVDLREALTAKGHLVRYDVTDVVPGDDWRRVLTEGLQQSDATVALISTKTLSSTYVMSEIGAARILGHMKDTLLLPILIGDVARPQLIDDVFSLDLKTTDKLAIEALAAKIDEALQAHARRLRGGYPRIFISHRHKDQAIAAALARLIEGTFYAEKHDIRCTSVAPYKLPAGERTPDRLRAEIARARAVLGIISPDTQDSVYVLFELGASWGQRTLTFPLLARGATPANLPPPISDRHHIQLSDPGDCHQLLDDLADVTGLKRRESVSGNVDELVRQLVREAGGAAERAG